MTLVRCFAAAVHNPASAVYLGLVGISVVIAATEPLWSDHGGESLIWVWPAFFTSPTFFFVVPVAEAVWGLDLPAWSLIGGIIVSALIQSLVLGLLLEALRGWRRRHAHPYGG
ncbi:hypothetical protein H1D24_38810 [Streptomyces sp. PSKA28]|uniref:Uncharacterized protein n=1 Tax=Streptomyces himalayensis subsp. himalayensis TaxID=2756131 RepID=A0A7W0DUK2_9ACTN|nr:hypothetical protein [Streptomyces himalayensis subsp. himalayensis]